MLITFLISQQNNIRRIRRCIENICTQYGERIILPDGREYYGFPKPQALATASEEDLRACNLGYRAKYVHQAALDVADGRINLSEIQSMSYKKAREALQEIYGVGGKVADCSCLSPCTSWISFRWIPIYVRYWISITKEASLTAAIKGCVV